ncbi:hypothetical protein ACFY3N_17560 [Streptomyces sp. NPDC000348]|uniref:hypothetical protein n=1 Tax=Streptomyces sp. NPDC000348 TaxID=3364538 RepID=UPI003685D36B
MSEEALAGEASEAAAGDVDGCLAGGHAEAFVQFTGSELLIGMLVGVGVVVFPVFAVVLAAGAGADDPSVFVASDVDLALSAGVGAGGELLDESFIMAAQASAILPGQVRGWCFDCFARQDEGRGGCGRSQGQA